MKTSKRIYQLKVSLKGIKPQIWRRFQVRSDVKFTKLHTILQKVMGWEDSHLYLFLADKRKISNLDSWADGFGDPGITDGSKVKLSEVLQNPGDSCTYIYDIGDEWEHKLRLEKILEPAPNEKYPLCLDGARNCPLEDCGGVPEYENILTALQDSKSKEYADLREWVGDNWDPEEFDCDSVNQELDRKVYLKIPVEEPSQQTRIKSEIPKSDIWMTDLSHFLDENGNPPTDISDELRDSIQFFTNITRAASSHISNKPFLSMVQCRRTIDDNICGSWLSVEKMDRGQIHWKCPICGEEGFISNWQKTRYDLTEEARKQEDESFTLIVTKKEYELLQDILIFSSEEEAILFGGVSTAKGVRLSGYPESFDLLIDSLAAAANHAEDSKQQRALDKIYDKVENALDKFI